MDKTVDVGAGERDDKRVLRIKLMEPFDRARATPCMQRDHQIGGLTRVFGCHPHAVSKNAQNARPARRGGAISATRALARRRDQANFHLEDVMTSPVATAQLRDMLRDARTRTLQLVVDLDDDQLWGPRLDIVN